MHAAKAVLRRKFTTINTYIKQKDLEQLNLTSQGTRKEEQMKPKVSRRKETTKIKVEINEIETKPTVEKINENKSCIF